MTGNKLKIFITYFLLAFLAYPSLCSALEHPRYDIKAQVDVEHKRIEAVQTVTFTNNSAQAVDELYFHVYPNRVYTKKEKGFLLRFAGYFKTDPYPEGFPERDMEIRSVTQDRRKLEFQIEGKDQTFLKVSLNKPLEPKASVTVSIDFVVGVPHAIGRFGWHENILKASRWYPILSVHNDEGWHLYPFYPFHRPFFSEASYYAVELTVPAEQVVIHSGHQVGERENAQNKVLQIESELPIREFTFAMSPDYQLVEEEWDGIAIKSFYLPGDEFFGREALKNATQFMKYYSKLFGPYKYKQFSIAPVHLGYGGEQMSNMIFIDTRVYQLPKMLVRYFDFLISHETGHQWLYNMIGIDEYTQIWLEEGVHSYFLMEYLTDKYGDDARVLELPESFEKWEWTIPKLTFQKTREIRYQSIARIGYDGRIVGKLSSFKEPSSIFSLAYAKGSRVVSMLNHSVDAPAFDRVFKRIYQEYQHLNLDIDDFIRICEEESGEDLSWFFDQWLYSSGQFDYAIADVNGRNIVLKNRGEIQMPVDVRVDYKNGEHEDFVWDGQVKEGTITVSKTTDIARVRIDPEEKLLDIDRTNNSWPRQIHTHIVPYYFALYDFPVFLPEDGYNVVVGPELFRGLGMKASVQKPYDQIFYGGTSYEFGEDLHHSRVGYQLRNVLNTQTAVGFEIDNTNDLDDGDDENTGGRIYIRRELWPVQYGLTDINDHVTLYLLRNQRLNDFNEFVVQSEDDRNLDFSRRNESIVGTALHLNRSGPYPDPRAGYQLDWVGESAGHFLGATQYFHRSSVDVSMYQPVTNESKLALRLKYGWGYPEDKELFYLGGSDGLRGFRRKTVRGANAVMGSLEYRFPLVDIKDIFILDNFVGLDSISGVVFYDGGQGWFSSYDAADWKHDAGFGLRFSMRVGSFFEKLVVRADVAQALGSESGDDPEFWFGLNQAF